MDNSRYCEIVVASGTHVSGGVASRYAIALYAQADDTHQLDSAVEQMEALGRMIDESAPLRRLLSDPTVDAQVASKAAIAVLAGQGIGKLVRDFVGVIAANRRLGILRTIVTAFAKLVADKRGIVVAEVTSAQPISDVQREQLRARLIEAGYGQVRIQDSVDPSLLGGLVVRVGARLYDTSLKSRLQRLQFAMKGAA
ncbi:MAG: ATP synthase F1 subunit delta [Pseudomonadota bacterium]|nr:ATP synthase F1 subunit delta [Pseudomonadota bacterium]